MGIFGALITSVSGLRSQSYALENISGNIANSQTTAYKRIDTSFSDLVGDATPRQQIGGGALSFSRSTNLLEGDIQGSTVETNMAIKGEGFFVVQRAGNFVDNRPVFDGVDLYTRRGDFQLDRDGYLVNGAGYYLKALSIDPTTGNITGSVPEVMQFQSDFLPANATTEIEYRANLATYPKTSASDTEVANSELINPTTFSAGFNPLTTTGVVAQDEAAFLEQSISGGAVTVYDVNGSPANLQIRWAKSDSVANGGTDTWHMFYESNSLATGTQIAWTRVPTDYEFSAAGHLTSPASPTVAITGLTINGVSIGNVSINHGIGGLTQYADPNGNVTVGKVQQDGYAAGDLKDIAVSEGGRVVASYTNGRSAEIAQISLCTFYGTNFLKKLDGGAFAQTAESGPALQNGSGTIVGKSLEGSNTDIADEFTKLIVTQQAYSANTRVVSTANDMLREVLQMSR